MVKKCKQFDMMIYVFVDLQLVYSGPPFPSRENDISN